MSHRCPACQRSFAEPGYCPFDGTQLAPLADADQPTLLQEDEPSVAVRAVSASSAEGGHADAVDEIRKKGPRGSEYDRLIGETLDGRYYVLKKLGEGGMGVVFAVKHTVIERPLAIKVLKREVMRDQATVKRFIQEARAASRIGHPNIVDVTDFGNTADGMTYQVMELIDGTTLKAVIKGTAPLPVERAIRIAQQIARALAAAHAKGIVHRDLKPENVFLTEREGRPDFVKIVDFGIAKVQPIEGTLPDGPRITRQGSVFGTPEYMAPEQAAGRSDTDHRVDVYALGTILYEMLVAKTPHKGGSMIQTIAMQMLDPVIPPSKRRPELTIPSELEAIVVKALQKKREDRFATMADMQVALEALEAQAAVAPVPEGPPRRAKPPTRPLHEPQFVESQAPVSFDHIYNAEPVHERPSRWPMLVAGLAMLVLGAGGAILLIMQVQKEQPVVTGEATLDAASVSEIPTDAGVADLDAQAIAEAPIDAGARMVTTDTSRRDAGVATSGVAPPSVARPGRGTVTIEVMTRPGDANVFIGANYRGPSGVRLTERRGTKLEIECKTDRMKGSVEVTFDGKVSAVMCTAARDRFCVPGLKNPYDDCEEAPTPTP